jgi:hypothetical protein
LAESEEISVEPLYLTNSKKEIILKGHVAVHKTRKVRDVAGYQNVGIPKGWTERVIDFLKNPLVDISLAYTDEKGWIIIIESPQKKPEGK